MPRLAALVALCAVLLLAPTAAAKGPVKHFGINGGGIFNQSDEAIARSLGALRAAGVGEVRADLSWSGIQPEPGAWDWRSTDRTVTHLARAGLRLYPVAAYSATWSASVPGDVFSGPRDPAEYAAFVAAAVARYGPGGAFWSEHPELPRMEVRRWEIWNEPNTETYWRKPSPERMATLYRTTRAAMRAVRPDVQAVVGGLVGFTSTGYLRRFYAALGRRPQVDAVGFHTYLQSAGQQVRDIAGIRAVLDDVDPGTPIELTEFGLSTHELTEEQRAERFAAIVARIARDRRLGVRAVMPFSMITSESGETWSDHLGVFNTDGTPKLAGAAYLDSVLRAVSGAGLRGSRPPRPTPGQTPRASRTASRDGS